MPDNEIESIREENPQFPDYFYDYTALRRYPLIRLDDDLHFPIFHRFFQWRVTEGIYWDIWSELRLSRRNNSYPINEQGFAQKFGFLFERYVQNMFDRALGASNELVPRVWREPKTHEQAPATDLIIRYPDAYIFIEVKATRPKYVESVVHGDITQIEDDLRQMLFDPIEQIKKSIDHFRQGNLSEEGLEWHGEQIFPIIVTYGSLLDIGGIQAMLQQNDIYRTMVDDPHIAPFEYLDPEDVARLASLVQNGHKIDDVLARRHASPQYLNLPIKTYFLEVYGDISEPRHILGEEWESFTQIVEHELFG